MSSGTPAPPAAPVFDITVPSIRRIHNLIKDKQEIEVKLLSGDVIKGTLKWIDTQCLCVDCLGEDRGHSMVIWLSAIAFVKYRPV